MPGPATGPFSPPQPPVSARLQGFPRCGCFCLSGDTVAPGDMGHRGASQAPWHHVKSWGSSQTHQPTSCQRTDGAEGPCLCRAEDGQLGSRLSPGPSGGPTEAARPAGTPGVLR